MRVLAILAVVVAVGCTKKPTTVTSATPAPATPPATTNYQPGGGAVQNIRQAARRTVALNDLRNFSQLVEIEYNELGKMPPKDRMAEIAAQVPNIKAAIDDGSVVLTGTADHGGVWAYEADAPTKGGLAVVGGTPLRVDSVELTNKLKQ